MARTRIPFDYKWEAEQRRGRKLASAVAELDLDIRIVNGLEEFGVLYVSELIKLTPDELGKIPNFGEKSVTRIIQILAEHGLALCDGPCPLDHSRF